MAESAKRLGEVLKSLSEMCRSGGEITHELIMHQLHSLQEGSVVSLFRLTSRKATVYRHIFLLLLG